MSKPTTLTAAIEAFLADAGAASTRKIYRTGVLRFQEFIDGDDLLSSIRGDDLLVEFWRWLRKQKPRGQWQKDTKQLSAQSVRTYIAAAVSLLEWLNAERLFGDGFSLTRARSRLKKAMKGQHAGYPTRSADPRLPAVVLYYDALPLPELTVKHAATGRLKILRGRAIMQVFYSTGARISEIARLNRAQVGQGRADSAIIVGKGNKQRSLFFTPEAKAAMQTYLAARTDGDEALFVNLRPGGRMTSHALWEIVKHAARMCDLTDVHPHDFRHLRAEQMLNEGARLEDVQEFLGHADISTTRRIYAPFSTATARAAFDTYRLTPAEAMDKALRAGH